MRFTVQQPPTYKQFILNMEEKIQDPDFLGDSQLLLRPEISFNPQEAYLVVKERLWKPEEIATKLGLALQTVYNKRRGEAILILRKHMVK